MDILDDILDTLDLKGVLYFRTDFSGPWGVTVPDLSGAARFHLVLQGGFHFESASGETVELGLGDIILIPRGRPHVLTDQSGRSAPPLETLLDAVGYDGNGVLTVGEESSTESTQLLCGHFSFRNMADHPILKALPDYILITAAMRQHEPWLDELLRMVAQRSVSGGLGSAASVTRLSEIVFIEILRAGIGQSESLAALLEGFGDRQIGRAMELIHRSPEQPWSVETLAVEVGMSRSRFAERFRQLVGTSPAAYLSDWRLQKALSLLEGPQCQIKHVANQTGYQSAAAFSRAFTGRFGCPPTEYRRDIA